MGWRRDGRKIRKKVGMKWKSVMRDYNRWGNGKKGRALLSIEVRAGSGSERDDERKGSPLYR